jgi:hypothetical protein
VSERLVGRLDLVEKLAEVGRDVPSCQPERKEWPEQSSAPFQVADRDDLDAASIIRRRDRVDLPGAPGLEEIRVDDSAFDGIGLRLVVAKALPHKSYRPRVAFGDVSPRLSTVVEGEMLCVHVPPIVGTAGGEVSGCFQDSFRACGALLDDVNPRHQAMISRVASVFAIM